MAACGSLQHFFENPMPENPTLLESLASWKQMKSMKPIELSSFTEIFGELHFKEKPESLASPPPSSSLSLDQNPPSKVENLDIKNSKEKNPSLDFLFGTSKNQYTACSKNSDCFSSKNSESLQLCTEGLGFESSGEVEDSKNKSGDDWDNHEKEILEKYGALKLPLENQHGGSRNVFYSAGGGSYKRSSTNGSFPPPISCIGRSGKPWVYFRSYRHDGRFVLKEIRIPTQELLHASREDGRLKLHFVQPDAEIAEEKKEEEDDDVEEKEEEDDDDEEEEEKGEEYPGEDTSDLLMGNEVS
ncbi:uncharacterized protein LOC143866516 [Tasmannia lanceolata]|uniref:uncharacterized protein LOC143866516 n=1 Tax=Tasmannia lanceolata TaxID=3420 RepID=UPI0040636268